MSVLTEICMKNVCALSSIGMLFSRNFLRLILVPLILPIAVSLFSAPGFSQTVSTPPSCASVSDDPDGDGFGWVVSSQTSCVVTGETAPAPEFINRETGLFME